MRPVSLSEMYLGVCCSVVIYIHSVRLGLFASRRMAGDVTKMF